jgi:hypothetical protein
MFLVGAQKCWCGLRHIRSGLVARQGVGVQRGPDCRDAMQVLLVESSVHQARELQECLAFVMRSAVFTAPLQCLPC